MARMKHRFNQKARQSQKKQVVVVESEANKVEVDPEALGGKRSSGKYDEANALVLPSKKRKTLVKSTDKNSGQRLLSRKQKKKLEKIVQRREKKSDRAELLEELQKHQLPPEQYAKLTPLVQVQTEGLKKLLSEIEKGDYEKRIVADNRSATSSSTSSAKPKSSVRESNKLKYRSWSGRFGDSKNSRQAEKNPMVLDLDESEDSSSTEEEEESGESVKKLETDGKGELGRPENEDNMEEDSGSEVENTDGVVENQPEIPEEVVDVKPDVELVAVKVNVTRKMKQFVQVSRTREIEAVRAKLPIIPEEQVIMESVSEKAVTVLAGETGSGKTTQVPQFLYEAGFALNGKMIGVTEPRRVAAISMSHRVAKELNLSTDVVSYQIRFEGNAGSKTKIKFMTDGVLLKEIEKDFLLSKYSAICIDEAHERSLYTDILIGLLSRCVQIRQKRNDPLKLIIMSATMRVEDFQENPKLFKSTPGLIHVPTRQFSVQIHFNKVTPENYVLAAYKKAVQIHRRLPPGGILIFLTGQQEVRTMVSKLRKRFPKRKDGGLVNQKNEMDSSFSKKKRKRKQDFTEKKKHLTNLRTFDLDKMQTLPLQSGEEEEQDVGSDASSDEFDIDEDEYGRLTGSEWNLGDDGGGGEPLHILPLYSMLPSYEQQKVFETPPDGQRLCVVATNVAETSLTIPSIRYVVDVGKVKTKEWDKLTGVQQFRVTWCSKASAEQRSGRAGRTGPGHCYRLYSSAVFDSDFEQYSPPEIVIRPVEDMMLFMKSIGIDRVQNFPYPTHPGENQLRGAEQTLVNLGALELQSNATDKKKGADMTTITDLGKTMAHFPLSPRFSKMLALSFHHSVVEFAVALVAALTVQEVFLDVSLHESSKETKSSWAKLRHQWAGTGPPLLLGDCQVILRAVGAFEYEGGSEQFCQKSGLRFKAMKEIRKLRKQLTSEVNLIVQPGDQELPLNPRMKPPTDEEATLLRQILLSGLPDRIARRVEENELKEDEDKKKFKHAYRCGELEEPVIMHTSSVLRSTLPDWVVYQEIFESNGKMYMRGVTAIESSWIPSFCKSMCNVGKPLDDPPPYFDEGKGIIMCFVKSTYGKQGWELPVHETEFPYSLEKFKIFAQFLLQGDIFPKLAEWRSDLLSLPVTMTKPWAKLQPRTQKLLNALTSKKICTKSGLLDRWSRDKNYLLEEYLEWLAPKHHVQVTCHWPPLS